MARHCYHTGGADCPVLRSYLQGFERLPIRRRARRFRRELPSRLCFHAVRFRKHDGFGVCTFLRPARASGSVRRGTGIVILTRRIQSRRCSACCAANKIYGFRPDRPRRRVARRRSSSSSNSFRYQYFRPAYLITSLFATVTRIATVPWSLCR